MKNTNALAELEAQRARFEERYSLWRFLKSSEAPNFLSDLDLSGLASIWGGEEKGAVPLFQGAVRLWERLSATEEGRRRVLEDDLALWRALEKQAVDISHKGLLGFKEAVFPVKVQGVIVHAVRSGKWRDEAFTSEQVKELAQWTGLPLEQASALAAAVPVFDVVLRERLLAVVRQLRDVLQVLLHDHLRMGELTRQLAESEKIHSLGTLSAGVAHHFNNLLSVILGYATYVLNREDLSRDASRSLHKVCEAAQSGRRLTEELLAFLGSEVEDAIPCRVHDSINSVLSLLESKTGARVKVVKNLDARNDTVLVEPSVIRQIVFNLLTNALDSMPQGGAMTIHTYNRSGESAGSKKEYLVIEVTDSGGVETASPKGRGLRLSSVYGMVGRLEGTVAVAGEPGLATRVEVQIPTVMPSQETVSAPRARKRLAKSSIWVVDDDPIFREMCRQVLSDAGHIVQEIGSGKEFLERWKTEKSRPDLLIIDFSMPEYNGYQLCQWLREEGFYVPIILVSGFAANQPDIRKALKLRKTFFLQKPFSFREMTDTVTVALGETLIGE
jgi:CheY-like chemotaxis protein